MMASIGSSCSPTVWTKFITKSDSFFFVFLQSGLYIEPQLFYYKVRAEKLRQAKQSETIIAKCHRTSLHFYFM